MIRLKSLIKTLINGSTFLLLLRRLLIEYSSFRFFLERAVIESKIYKIISIFRRGTRLNFKESFLGKITEINKERDFDILGTSNAIKQIMKLFNQCKYKIINYSKTSIINSSINKLDKGVYLFPVKTASIIIIIVMITNVSLSFLLKNEIGLSGWLVYGIILFIACNGLYSKVSLEELAKTSYFLKRLNNPCKI